MKREIESYRIKMNLKNIYNKINQHIRKRRKSPCAESGVTNIVKTNLNVTKVHVHREKKKQETLQIGKELINGRSNII